MPKIRAGWKMLPSDWLKKWKRALVFWRCYFLQRVKPLNFSGPSVKLLVQNVHTSGELKMSGNCLRGSRPLLSFDATFDLQPHLALVKSLLVRVFGVPRHHPRSQPFVDRVTSFSVEDGRIWMRNYQILDEHDAKLEEIGEKIVFFLWFFSGVVYYMRQPFFNFLNMFCYIIIGNFGVNRPRWFQEWCPFLAYCNSSYSSPTVIRCFTETSVNWAGWFLK